MGWVQGFTKPREGKSCLCVEGVGCIKLSQNGSLIKLYNMTDVPYIWISYRELDFKYGNFFVNTMKPFIFLLWHRFSNLPANDSFITVPLLTPLLFIVFYCKTFYQPRFHFFILPFDRDYKMANKRIRCVLCVKVSFKYFS